MYTPVRAYARVFQIILEVHHIHVYFLSLDQNVNRSTEVQSIVEQSLKYLDTRTKFWRQTLPLHALRSMQTRNFQLPVASLAVRDDAQMLRTHAKGFSPCPRLWSEWHEQAERIEYNRRA